MSPNEMLHSEGKQVLVTGAGGFIGSHLVKYLKAKGYWVRGVDIKKPQFSPSPADEFTLLDLRSFENCLKATEGVEQVYNFAANMGGIGFISRVYAQVMHDNVLINANMLEASVKNKVERFFFASSACVYPGYAQAKPNIQPLREQDAYPACPDSPYGWEKLFTEKMCWAYHQDYDLKIRVARYHNVYGPEGTFEGGREKAPASLCRKVVLASNLGEIEVWGDGKQTRSFLYVDDAVEATYKLMNSDYPLPLNIGSDRLVTIDKLANMIIAISGKQITKRYDLSKPQGVRGRNADLRLCHEAIGWRPKVPLEEGLRRTYQWIKTQLTK